MLVTEEKLKQYDSMIDYFNSKKQPINIEATTEENIELLEKENEDLKADLFNVQSELQAKTEEFRLYEEEVKSMSKMREQLEIESNEEAKLKAKLSEEYEKREKYEKTLSELTAEFKDIETELNNFISENNLLSPKQAAEYKMLQSELVEIEKQLEEENKTKQQLETINGNLSKALKKEQSDRIEAYIEYIKFQQKWEYITQQKDQNDDAIKSSETQMKLLKDSLTLMKQKLQKMEPYIKKIYVFLQQNAVISNSFLSENSVEMINEL